MKLLIKPFGRLRLLAIVLTLLPMAVLPVLGAVWLWQSRYLLYWLILLLLCAALGYGMHLLLRWRESRSLPAATTQADPRWPVFANAPWQEVEAMANEVTPESWPLKDAERLFVLGRNTLDLVARHYHPEREKPLLELTVPHMLLIIERASRDLRLQITEHIPFSHRLTLGALVRARHWKEVAAQWEKLYRVGRAALNPASALFREVYREIGNRIVSHGLERVQIWLLQEYVRKVGYYAIELYSGNLLLGGEDPTAAPTGDSLRAAMLAEEAMARIKAEPLHILVLGRANAGKSSLINALFGELTAAADVLPDTTSGIWPYRLEREGQMEALIFDTPGCDTPLLKEQALKRAVLDADLILWVSAAHRPDRQAERERLDRLRHWLNESPKRRPAPVLVAVSHIDRLRPPREWQPPYDLNNPTGVKAQNIQAAVLAVAEDLNLPAARCVPVCLADDRRYNVNDALWAVILAHQNEAGKVRFLRCMATRRREENWDLMWRQLGNAGRFLLELKELYR